MPLGSSVITVKGQGDPGLRLQLNHDTGSSCLFFKHSNLKHISTGQSFYKYIGNNPYCLNELLIDQFWQTNALVTGESPAGGRSVSGCRCVCGWPGPSPESVR